MVNAEPCSMGGVIDYGVGFRTKSSPRSRAIEKAQEELRQECNVQEERRRELEFLEKGGNPLDFEFGRVAEQNVTSECKGSFALSFHGDSIESSDIPGSSLCRETNSVDNIVLLGGDNSDIVEEKVLNRGTKRLNAAQLKQALTTYGHNNAKKFGDSGFSCPGVKSQAYARRHRSRPSREGVNVASVRPSVSPGGSESKDEKVVVQKQQVYDHGILSLSSFKQSGSNCNNAPDAQAAMELDGIQTISENVRVVKNEAKQGGNNSKATEVSSNDAKLNQMLVECGSIAVEVASLEIPDADSKVVARPCHSCVSTPDEMRSCAGDVKADHSHLDKHTKCIPAGERDSGRLVSICAVEAFSAHKIAVDPPCEDTINIIDDHADEDLNLVASKIDGTSHVDLSGSRLSNKAPKESDQSAGFTSGKKNSDSMQPGIRNAVYANEAEFCDSALIAQKDGRCLSSGCNTNIEEKPASDRKNSCLGNSNSAHPIAVAANFPETHLPDSMHSLKIDESNVENEITKSEENLDKVAKRSYEDSIIRNACDIEANVKKAGERSPCNISLEKRRNGHWDFVLEEMAWMANDFMQERLWKSVAAAQVCHLIAYDGWTKFREASIQRKQKNIMKSLAKSVIGFWHSAEAIQTPDRTTEMIREHNSTMLEETEPFGIKPEKEHGNNTPMNTEESRQLRQLPIMDYAVRFLEYNNRAADSVILAEAPPTPDRQNDFGILKVSDQLSQESLFYTVAPGAILAYRESMESLFEYHKKVGNVEIKDDYEASVCNSTAGFLPENTYEEDNSETCTYLSPDAYDGCFLSKKSHKKEHLMHQRFVGARPYEIGTIVPYEPCLDTKSGNRPLLSNGKRPPSLLTVPTKRICTTTRQRVVSPFHPGASEVRQVMSKTYDSSEDTDSYQDDQSSLHGGSLPWRNMDDESTVDFVRRLPYDDDEVCTKATKKKKLKKPGHKTAQNVVNSCVPAAVKGCTYDQRLQVGLITKYEQRDYVKKRSEIQQYDSNGNNAANGCQHASKKLKMMKHGIDISHEAHTASQTSNMASSARFMKRITNRDGARKFKALKMASSGGWSSIEDQALVILIHDLGQNWELVSDAINSISLFKPVHRQPKECKERHKVLVDKSFGDGADSAEDSGSSQHYNNPLPGIPKGSARLLFKRIHGPLEEENLKAHFEKIILLMQQMNSRRRQGNNQKLKPILQQHNSHLTALPQACPNNLSMGTLTPLDLCDITSYPGSHTNGLPLQNYQGSIVPTATSNLNSTLPGPPGIILNTNLPCSSTLHSPRDAQKHSVPRPTYLQGDEQQKIQYMSNNKTVQQPGVSPCGFGHGACSMPGAHGIGVMAGLNRGMPAAKAGFRRIDSPGTPNVVSSGNQSSNFEQGMACALNVHPGAISGTGNSILRPHDPMQIFRIGQSMEEQRQMADSHKQAQGNSQTSHFSSINPSFSNIAAASPIQQAQPQQQHKISLSPHMFGNPDVHHIQGTNSSPQQQAYAMHPGKERQMQQCMAPQQHNDLSVPSAVPRVHSDSQIPHKMQNQASATDSVLCSQSPHQQDLTAQNPLASSSSPSQLANATLQKQKKQQGQQQSRQNQQQRNQGSQQAKLMKSLGRGNMIVPLTPPVDSTPSNAVSAPSKTHIPDQQQMQYGQGLSPANIAPGTTQAVNQPKVYPSLSRSTKQLPDTGNHGSMQNYSSQNLLASQQPPLHSQQQQRRNNPSQNNIQRTLMKQNCQMNCESRSDSHMGQVHNQMVPTGSILQSKDSGNPVFSSVKQHKREASHNLASVTLSSKLLTSPKGTLGNGKLFPSSSKDVLERQISGSIPMHGQSVGGQWNQQSRQQLQAQHQQKPLSRSSVCAPSNSGPG